MRKVIAAINITIDGFCDHTLAIADDELHQHYTELLHNAGVLLYGRKTYELMGFWRPLLKEPIGNKAMDEFAVAIDSVPKLVFSRTLTDVDWDSAKLAKRGLTETVSELKSLPGKDIFACSPSLISTLTGQGLIDEFQLCVHPVIAGSGLPLFKHITDSVILKLTKTKEFRSGAIIHSYRPGDQHTIIGEVQ